MIIYSENSFGASKLSVRDSLYSIHPLSLISHLSPHSLSLPFPPVPPSGRYSFLLHLSSLFFCIILSLQPLTTGHLVIPSFPKIFHRLSPFWTVGPLVLLNPFRRCTNRRNLCDTPHSGVQQLGSAPSSTFFFTNSIHFDR